MQTSCPACGKAVGTGVQSETLDANCPHCGSPVTGSLPETSVDLENQTLTYPKAIPVASSTPPVAPRRRFGGYEIIEEIDRGGMGIVYKARQLDLNRLVALKVIRSGGLASAEQQRRFQTEAEAAAKLDHPNIVPVYEVGRENDQPYLSMALVEGSSLSARLADGPLPRLEAVALVAKLAQAIEYAHGQGVVHRDLKPHNVLLDQNGQPRITDFGLAKDVFEDTGMTATGEVLGTPAYMSPEQAMGAVHAIDPRTDVYSLGVVLFELLTGNRPFRGNVRMLLHQIIHDEAPSPRTLDNSIPKDLETICLKCLEKDRTRRYDSALALFEDLRSFAQGRPVSARPIGRMERGWRWCKRNRTVALLGSSLILVLAVLSVVVPWVVSERADRRHREEIARRDRQVKRLALEEQAKSLLSASAASREADAFDQALEDLSELVGLTESSPDSKKLLETARHQQRQLTLYRDFMRSAESINHRIDRTDPGIVLGRIEGTVSGERRNQQANLKAALESLGVLDDPRWQARLDDSLFSAEQKDRLVAKVAELLYLFVFSATSADEESNKVRPETGLTALDRLVAIDGHSRSEWMVRMWLLDRLGKTEQANEARRRMAETDPQTPRDFFWLGYIALKRGRPEEAVERFRRVLEMVPNHFSAHFSLFECYFELKDREGQLRELTACLALTPDDPNLFVLRGLTYFLHAERDPKAIVAAHQEFDAAIRRDPRLPTGWYYRGRMRVIANQWAEAEADLTKCLEIDSKFRGAHYWRAVCRANQGEYREAVEDAEQAVRVQPTSATAHEKAARAYVICADFVRRQRALPDRLTLSGRFTDRGLDLLEKAFQLGFDKLDQLGPGSDFDPVRANPRFRRLVTSGPR